MKYLSMYAGPRAREIIAEHGLTPDMVEVVAGAAGGPKWLALYGLDKAMFTSWLMERTSPVFLLGSSVGTWRFAALAQGMEAHERFRDAYLRQRFTVVPTAAQASAEIMKFLDAALDGDGPSRILTHPYARLTFLAVRCSGPYGVDRKYPLLLLMAAAGILNTASRGLLRLFFSRVLFHDPRDLPPYHALKGFPLQSVPLTVENVRPAVMASGSMPVIMTGVRDIPGAAPGMYRDAGILDYHLAIPFASSRIVLFPHYTNRITPGWFDKMLPWRRPSLQDMANVVLLCPSPAFVASMPGGKIPSREDFREFWLKDDERIAFWKQALKAGEALGDEFLEAVETGSISGHLRPLELLARQP
jgi:hypothetical protein